MADTTKAQLGQRIQTLRKRARLKQEYVAEQVGIDAKSLSRIEGGSRYPSMETLAKIGRVMNVPLKVFFEFPEVSESPEVLRQYLRSIADELDEQQMPQVVSTVRDMLHNA